MAYASNIAALNAARAFMKAAGYDAAAYKDYFKVEKVDGEWHALQVEQFPAPRDPLSCLLIERDGIFAFPGLANAASAALTESESPLQELLDRAEFFASEPSDQEQAESDEAQANRQKAADALADSLQSAAQVNGKEWIRISSVIKPVKFVWAVADEMNAAALAAGKPAPTRKEVQDECVRRGVASGTARTQYQAWKRSRDNDLANAEKAAELSKRFNQK